MEPTQEPTQKPLTCIKCTRGEKKVECALCEGKLYCSVACKTADFDEHKVICGAYVDLPPRPSKDHRLHILLPFHPELEQGLVWRKDHEAAMNTIAPGRARGDLRILSPDNDEFHREIEAYYAFNPNPNVVLGNLVAGRPTRTVTGSLLSFVTIESDEGLDTGDALPSDLHKILHHVSLLERRYGPVKISLTGYGGVLLK